MLSVDANWTDAGENATHIAWVRNVIEDAQQFSNGGTYLNFDAPDEAEGAELVAAAFGDNLDPAARAQAEVRPRESLPAQQQHRRRPAS